jgi:hypothetical protein
MSIIKWFRIHNPCAAKVDRPHQGQRQRTRASALRALGAEEGPGFEVDFVEIAVQLFCGASGTEHEHVAFGFEDDAGGEDVPDIFGDDVGGEEVDGAGGVAGAVAIRGEGAEVSVAEAVAGLLDLHAEKVAAVFDANVVGGGISPGLGDFEAAAHGLRHKLEFDPLATNFEVLETLALRHVLRAFFLKSGQKKAQPVGCA